ncbi:hypothetical protein AJ80_02294 [Polytolypa hystricis UAMH7299]|uniref:Nephrocystin 3-like N-terminal domain-containing protein n=1 Tax=Polytolypa hystricis (strain UAMH7299) TaxID=1447883 RepID=A0A2B7YS26_POLH7|nr:hypothetical protein AJ80_02294 [Polytolypa hystricis UAMH7299]
MASAPTHLENIGIFGDCLRLSRDSYPAFALFEPQLSKMAEALGLAGNAVGLVSLVLQVSQISYQDAAELKGVDGLSSTSGTNGLVAALEQCSRELEQLKKKLEKKAAASTIRGKLYVLTWPFSEAEVKEKVEMLHRYSGIFSAALTADTLTVTVASYQEVLAMREDNDIKDLLAWYQPKSDLQSAASHFEQYCPGTSSYFITHDMYLSWQNGKEGLFLAYGQQAGAGKTILSSVILQDLHEKYAANAVITYHFFSCDRPKEPLLDALRHLVVQALSQAQSIPSQASDLWKRKSQSNADLIRKDLIEILISVANLMPHMFIVLDGLDECRYFNKLVHHISTLKKSGIKLLVTSRDLPHIKDHFLRDSNLEVRASKDDIHRYVNYRLEEDGKVRFDLIERRLKDQIATAIYKQVDGSFLLARLTMDHITSLTKIKKIRKSLSSLPTNEREAYQNTYDRILTQGLGLRDVALKALCWVSNVMRPLKMIELQHALAIEDEI